MLGRHVTRTLQMTLVALMSSTLLLAEAPNDLPGAGGSAVADAAMAGDVDTVRALLKQGADVNAAQGDGMSALHWAATREDIEMAEMLLYAGANVRASTRLGGFTPLILASKSGSADMIKMLLDASADPEAATTYGTTPVMYAAASGRTDAVNVLIDAGADVNAKENTKERTPLMFAAVNNRAEVIELLAANGADIHAATKTFDIASIEKKWQKADRDRRQEREKKLVEKQIAEAKAAGKPLPPDKELDDYYNFTSGEDKKKEGDQKSGFAKVFGWLPGVGGGEAEMPQQRRRRRRIPYGELVGNQGGLTALHLASRQGHREAVDVLLEVGAELNRQTGGDQTSPILIASINGHFDLANSMLERGADPNLESHAGATPLYAAINLRWAPKALYPQPRAHLQQELGYLEFMEVLLENGANPDARLTKKIWYSGYNFDLSGVNESGATPFWRAAYGTDVPAMKLLVKYGANPHLPTKVPEVDPSGGIGPRDERDTSGLPPVKQGGPAVSPLLAASGVGYGAGFAANSHQHALSGFMPTVKYLVEELGADVTVRDHGGYNAIHHAAARGDTEMIQYLFDKGCDVTQVSRRGQTTADMANGPVQRIQPFPEAVELLESLGSLNNDNCVSC